MSEIKRARRERVDAARSRRAIVDAAVRLLERGGFSGLGDVAAEAGLTRQTIYAHFGSRQDLLSAVIHELIGDYEARIRDARLEEGSASEALARLLAVSGELRGRGGAALDAVARMSTVEEAESQHDPVRDVLVKLVRRGQRQGEFVRALPATWLAAATIALGHAAAAEVGAGRLSRKKADRLVLESLLRLYGVRDGSASDR